MWISSWKSWFWAENVDFELKILILSWKSRKQGARGARGGDFRARNRRILEGERAKGPSAAFRAALRAIRGSPNTKTLKIKETGYRQKIWTLSWKCWFSAENFDFELKIWILSWKWQNLDFELKTWTFSSRAGNLDFELSLSQICFKPVSNFEILEIWFQILKVDCGSRGCPDTLDRSRGRRIYMYIVIYVDTC